MSTTTYGHGTGPRAQQALRDQQEREQIAEDLARWAGEDAEAEHDAEYARADLRHGTYCCMHAREDGARNMYAFAMELPLADLRRRHAAERARRPVSRQTTDALLLDVCVAARVIAEHRAAARGDIQVDVRRAGRDAEGCERYAAHYGQAPDVAMHETLIVRLRHLTEIEPPPSWEDRLVDRAKREGLVP